MLDIYNWEDLNELWWHSQVKCLDYDTEALIFEYSRNKWIN